MKKFCLVLVGLFFISNFSSAGTLQPAKALVPVFAAAAESINKGEITKIEKLNKDALFGMAFTLGLSQGISLSSVLNSNGQVVGKDTLCIPKDVSAKDMILIITAWLKKHPENYDNLAIFEIFSALNIAFPCTKN